MDESKRRAVSFGVVKIYGEKARTEEYCKEKSVPEKSRLESPTKKSKWQVFMFGFGTGKFPTMMELNDIKSRQLRQQTTNTVSDGGEDEIDRPRSGKKRWWLLLDVFRCGGGYEGDTAVKDLQSSFRTLKQFG